MSKISEILVHIETAYRTQQPVPFIRDNYPISEEEAYQVQHAFIERRVHKGDAVAGYKISMTSKETQAIANTNEPAYGTILTSHILQADTEYALFHLFQPLIEPELIFFVNEDITASADTQEIIEKTSIAPGIEIPDARYIDWFPHFSLIDLLADNTATGRIVVGDPVPTPSFEKLGAVDLDLKYNGIPTHTGSSSAVLGNPVYAVKWLIEKLAEHNRSLQKGMVISSGTFIPPFRAKAGEYITSYRDIGEVKITLI
ncbi:2-keto-4-pentenoate hydratase [Oceanobacillus sp. J11TS1]|uniref:2-keto-4-pentenoate hydratase n=1 Tax=Oceanobacillus sp. J11TS1 TaxID=2807191 RepID=UPI001B0BA24F|nr:2-keto-4-pentenoate hydratase [Oceanobacillus sp. J11TS1]GIO23365.1 2-keto-4-pentenoate hydratase [Oceanobacillus sp. J11TS1]